jgi:hypothetical protein
VRANNHRVSQYLRDVLRCLSSVHLHRQNDLLTYPCLRLHSSRPSLVKLPKERGFCNAHVGVSRAFKSQALLNPPSRKSDHIRSKKSFTETCVEMTQFACSVDVDASPVAVVLSSWRALGPSVNLSLSSSTPLRPPILLHKDGTLHQHDVTQTMTSFISLHIRMLGTPSPWFVAQWCRHFQDHTKAITLALQKTCRLHSIP